MMGFLWPRVTRSIAISAAIRKHAIEVEGAPPEKVVMIHHGVDVASLERGGKMRRTDMRGMGHRSGGDGGVWVGLPAYGAEGDWGCDQRRFAEVAKAVSEGARYVIAGDGDLRAELEGAQARACRDWGARDFLGWRADAADVMAAFDAFVNPSHWEGFGLVVLEAMAASLAVIATEVSALPEIVADGVTGWTSPFRRAMLRRPGRGR